MMQQDMLFIVLQRKDLVEKWVVYLEETATDQLWALSDANKAYYVKYTDKTAKKGKKNYYKVRAVKANEAGVDVFSAYSAAKAVKVK